MVLYILIGLIIYTAAGTYLVLQYKKRVDAEFTEQSKVLNQTQKDFTGLESATSAVVEELLEDIKVHQESTNLATSTAITEISQLVDSVEKSIQEYTDKYRELEKTGKSNEEELAGIRQGIAAHKKDFDQTKRYVIQATQKLEQRPEAIRQQLEKELKEHKKQISLLIRESNLLRSKVSKENDYLFNELTKIKDSSSPKRGEGIRY